MSAGPLQFKHQAIRASAGTGKTFALTNRYLALCAAGEAPDRILATTFTRKAAGEIQQRVLARLARGALVGEALNELRRQVDGELTHDACAALLDRLVRSVHRLRIGTLDSLFVGMAQAFALDLGLPVGWSISDETDDRRLRAQAIMDVLGDRPIPTLVQLMRLMSRDRSPASVAGQIDQVVGTMHSLYLEAPEESCWRWLTPPPEVPADRLQEAIVALGQWPCPTTKAGKPRRHWDNAIGNIVAAANARDFDALLDVGLVGRILAGEDRFDSVEIPTDCIKLLDVLIQQMTSVLVQRLAAQNEATYDLLAAFHEAYRRRQHRNGMLRFDDVTGCLANQSLAADLAAIYYRLDGLIGHLLLDEFQDTSLLQWRVLEPLALELVSDETRARSFFCVGDRKQAIYGWRGGEARIFDHLNDALHGQVAWDDLHESHRSSPVIMHTVNTVFERIIDNPVVDDCREAVAAWAEDFPEHRTAARKADLPGYAELRVTDAPNDDEDANTATCRAAAALIRSHINQWSGLSIGVLTRRNAAVARMIYELQAGRTNEDGQPLPSIIASEEGGNPLTDSPAVSCVLSLLTLADHPGDTAAQFHVAASPLGPIVEFVDHADAAEAAAAARRVGRLVRRRLVEDGYGATLFDLVRRMAEHCDARNLSRLLQLVELGHAFEPRATLRPSDFVEHVRTTRVDDPTSAPVRVMTVHQAKGLEFDVVVLPELSVEVRGRPPGALVDRPNPVGPIERVSCYAAGEMRLLVPELQTMHDQWLQRSVSDAMSTLYVALTRPRHALYMLVPPPPKKQRRTYARLLTEELCPDMPVNEPGVVWQAGDAAWHGAVEADALPPEVQAHVDVQLAPGRGKRRVLPRRTPSALNETDGVDLARYMQLERSAALERGSLIHAWCELIDWLDGGPPEADRLRAAAQRYDVASADIDALIDEFAGMIAAPQVAGALRREAYETQGELRVYCERPFAVRDGEHLMQGTFDRLVVVERNGKPVAADVIDFKTDRDVDRLDELVEHYRPQLEAYRRAAARLCHLDEANVTARLVFLDAGRVRQVL